MMTLDAVIVAVSEDRPKVLVVNRGDEPSALPSGALDDADATLELAIRRLIRTQAGLDVGYVEQLYTFGDRDRMPGVAPARSRGGERTIGVAYLALVRESEPGPAARWADVYALLPWEDRRAGRGFAEAPALLAALDDWARDEPERRDRVALAFGDPWDATLVLERYELLYEAGLVAERHRVGRGGHWTVGEPMASDHRRITATALGRLRGKLTYRPVVFELLSPTFRLLELQRTVEALGGMELHKQNFRRLVERSGLVEGTGERTSGTAGRPAELFRYRPSVQLERPRPGVRLPNR
jgi:hypothetical protein